MKNTEFKKLFVLKLLSTNNFRFSTESTGHWKTMSEVLNNKPVKKKIIIYLCKILYLMIKKYFV